MLGFIKKLFGGKTAETTAEAPYKIETPVAVVPPTSTVDAKEEAPTFKSDWPFPAGTPGSGFEESTPKKKPAAKKPAGEKKPAVKAKTARNKKAPAKKSKE